MELSLRTFKFDDTFAAYSLAVLLCRDEDRLFHGKWQILGEDIYDKIDDPKYVHMKMHVCL